MRQPSGPRVVELFSGAGLFGLGFKMEGFNLVRAVEIEEAAAATYAKNLGNHVEVTDVRRAKPGGRCEVIIAGPPCQGFSTLGKCDVRDRRNFLSLEVVKWAQVMRPKVVVIENVEPFLRSPIWPRVKRSLELLGYSVTSTVLNAHDFGVAQIRMRSFTIASRYKIQRPKKIRGFSAQTVRQAWEGLTKIPNGKNNHFSPIPSALALARMKLIPPEGDRKDGILKSPGIFPTSLVRLGNQAFDVWGRLKWDEPSNTLRTTIQNPSKGRYIHPEQNRVISLREAARLHSIPDSWEFLGTPYQISRQIGNSVPPGLSRAIARVVMETVG